MQKGKKVAICKEANSYFQVLFQVCHLVFS